MFIYNKKVVIFCTLFFLIINIKSCFNFFKFCLNNENNKQVVNNNINANQSIIEMNLSQKKKKNNENNENNNNGNIKNDEIFLKNLTKEMNRLDDINALLKLKKITPSFVFTYNIKNFETINYLFNINNNSLKFNSFIKSMYLNQSNFIHEKEFEKIAEPCFFSLNNTYSNTYQDFKDILKNILNINNQKNFISIKEIYKKDSHYCLTNYENNNDKINYSLSENFYQYPSESNEIMINYNNIDQSIKYILIEENLKRINRKEKNLNEDNILFSIQINLDKPKNINEQYEIIKKQSKFLLSKKNDI